MMAELELTVLPDEYEGPVFDKFLDDRTEFFIETMQDAADDYWHELSGNEVWKGHQMEIWWDRHIARFQAAVRRDVRREVLRERRRHRQRQVRLIRHLKSKIATLRSALAEKEAKLHEADRLIWELKETIKSYKIAVNNYREQLDYYRRRLGE